MMVSSATGELLPNWIRDHRSTVDDALWSDGYVLLRGFEVGGLSGFERSAAAACASLYTHYGDLPLASASESVYMATPYPKHLEIQFHNEASHTDAWPSRQLFYCVAPGSRGGEWLLCDGRAMLERLPSELVQRFRTLGLIYRRRFIEGLDVPWKQFFHVQTLGELVERVASRGYEVHAPSENDVTVSYAARAVLHLPERGLEAWFNQILLHHPAALPAEVARMLSKHFAPGQFPRTVCLGDRSEISTHDIQTIQAISRECSLRIQPHENDVLLVNNLIVAHGRCPYEGNRQVRVALGDRMTASDLGPRRAFPPATR